MDQVIPIRELVECTRCGENFPIYEKIGASLRCKKCRTAQSKEYARKAFGISLGDRSWRKVSFSVCRQKVAKEI